MYIGEGTFGLVRQARAEGIVESTPERNVVAVKTTRGIESDLRTIDYHRLINNFITFFLAKAPPEEINNFWEELQLMKNMLPHGNIINLLGHCTTSGVYAYT